MTNNLILELFRPTSGQTNILGNEGVTHLVTDVPRLDPLAKLQIALTEVEPSSLEQDFSLRLAVSWKRESI